MAETTSPASPAKISEEAVSAQEQEENVGVTPSINNTENNIVECIDLQNSSPETNENGVGNKIIYKKRPATESGEKRVKKKKKTTDNTEQDINNVIYSNINMNDIVSRIDQEILNKYNPEGILSDDWFRYYNICLAGEKTHAETIIYQYFKNNPHVYSAMKKSTKLNSINLYLNNFECVCNLTVGDKTVKLHYYDINYIYKILDGKKIFDKQCPWPIHINTNETTYINQNRHLHSPIKYMWDNESCLTIWFSSLPVNEIGVGQKETIITLNPYDIELLQCYGIRKNKIETFFKDAVQAIPLHYLVCLSIAVYLHYSYPDQIFLNYQQMEKYLLSNLNEAFSDFAEKIHNIGNHLFMTNAFPKLNAKIHKQRYKKETYPYKQTLPYVLMFLRREIWELYLRQYVYSDCPVENCWKPRCFGLYYHIPDYGNENHSVFRSGFC